MGGLVLLALRRTLAPWLVLGLLLLHALAARTTQAASFVSGDAQALLALRALVRQNVWSVLLLAAPLLFFLAARLGRPEALAWLAPTASRPRARALALVLGILLAVLGTVLLTAAAGELAVAGGFPSWRRLGAAESPRALLLEGEPRVRWSVTVPEEAELLVLTTTVALGSGPAVTARFSATSDGGESHRTEARVAGRTRLTLPLPPGHRGAFELALERDGPGALLVLPSGALEVLERAPSERLAALTLGASAFLVLASGCALAFALARALRPALAAALAGALLLVEGPGRPGAEALGGAWTEVGLGLVPNLPPLWAVLGAGGAAALGVLLQARAGGRA